MTREQRYRSHHRQALQAVAERLAERPRRLSEWQVRHLLGELCVDLGICLPPAAYDRVESQPPTNPREFAELVMRLEGIEIDDHSRTYEQVLERVLSAFGRVPEQSDPAPVAMTSTRETTGE
jgi:Fe-S-cluster formation regulator IscX/YfhJ